MANDRRTEKNSLIVFGPQGCGKTRNKDTIAKHFGLTAILDGWERSKPAPSFGHLILTNDLTVGLLSSRRVLSYERAMEMVQTGVIPL